MSHFILGQASCNQGKPIQFSQTMTSLVDMRYTLLAPMSSASYDSESDSVSSEESFPVTTSARLTNDPILGNMEYWNNELIRLGDELCKYGVADIFMENKKSPDDIPSFPELFPCIEDVSNESDFFADIEMDIESETESLGRFSCCCSEQCRSYDSTSDWSYPSSPRSFGLSSSKNSDNMLSFSTQANNNCMSSGQDLNDLTPFNFTSSILKEQLHNDLRIKNETGNEGNHIPVKTEEQNFTPMNEESPEIITPSPVNTEDEEDTGDCTYNIISRVSDVSIKNESGYQEITKKRRLNSISSDSDQSEDYIKEPSSARKRPGKLKNRPEAEGKHGNYKPKQLYQFLMELLRDEEYCPQFIEWVSRDEKVFRLVDSAAVARMWGECKNRENMTYEKMSRALRYYYENGILERVPNCRLHYRFGKNAYEEYASTW